MVTLFIKSFIDTEIYFHDKKEKEGSFKSKYKVTLTKNSTFYAVHLIFSDLILKLCQKLINSPILVFVLLQNMKKSLLMFWKLFFL